jgi:hypothetical protein
MDVWLKNFRNLKGRRKSKSNRRKSKRFFGGESIAL